MRLPHAEEGSSFSFWVCSRGVRPSPRSQASGPSQGCKGQAPAQGCKGQAPAQGHKGRAQPKVTRVGSSPRSQGSGPAQGHKGRGQPKVTRVGASHKGRGQPKVTRVGASPRSQGSGPLRGPVEFSGFFPVLKLFSWNSLLLSVRCRSRPVSVSLRSGTI